MDTKLILVEGVSGAGKSVAAQAIARRLREAGKPVRWWYEEEVGHALYVFHDQATLDDVVRDLFSGRHARVVEAAIAQWARFVREAERADTIAVADGALLGYLTWTLHFLDRPSAEMAAYVRAVADTVAPLAPRLVYLRHRDMGAAQRNVAAVRGAGWAQRNETKIAGSAYCRARGLEGFDGVVRCWADYQALADRLADEVRLPTLAIDVAAGDWAGVERGIGGFLDLPPARAVEPGELGRFAGAYRASDGSVARVELSGAGLTVCGLRQVWPGQRLIPIGPDAFDVLSLPFTIRFAGDTMLVDGPELFGGRPPTTLTRVHAE